MEVFSSRFKGIVHPKNIPLFVDPQIIGVYDILLSNVYNQIFKNQKLVILLYKVLNMDIFLTQTHCFTSEGLY